MYPSREAGRIILAGVALALLVGVLTPRIYGAEGAVQTSLAVAMFALSVGTMWIGYSTIVRNRGDMTPAVIVAGLFVLGAGFTLWPYPGADVNAYVAFGWMQSHYHLSPYGHAITDLPGFGHDPMLAPASAGEYFPYGPALAWIVRFACMLSGANPSHAVLVFKIANVVLAVAIAAMTASVAVGLGSGRRDVVVYLFLCQPLIAIEFPGEGHNELFTVVWLVLAIFLAERDWLILVLPAIAIGAIVKFVPALAAPFAFIYVARHRSMRAAIGSAALAVVVCLAITAPYLNDWTPEILRHTIAQQFESYQTLPAAIGYIVVTAIGLISSSAPRNPARIYEAIAGLALVAYAAFFAWQCLRFARRPMPQLEDLIEAATLVLVVFLCLARPKYDPYYVAMFLPVALMLDRRHWLSRAAIGLSLAGLLAMGLSYKVPIASFLLLIGLPLVWSRRNSFNYRMTGSRGAIDPG